MVFIRRRVSAGRGHSRVRGQWWSVCQSVTCFTALVMCTRARRSAVRRQLATPRRRCRGIQPPNAVIHGVHSPAPTLSQSTRRSRWTQAFHVHTRRRSPGAVPLALLHLTPAGERSPAPNPTTTLNPTRLPFSTRRFTAANKRKQAAKTSTDPLTVDPTHAIDALSTYRATVAYVNAATYSDALLLVALIADSLLCPVVKSGVFRFSTPGVKQHWRQVEASDKSDNDERRMTAYV